MEQRQRLYRTASNGRCGAPNRKAFQSMVCSLASGGIGYTHAPLGEFRFDDPSIRKTSPSAPDEYSSRAFSYTMELTRWLPTCMMRLPFRTASTIAKPSSTLCDIGFSQ